MKMVKNESSIEITIVKYYHSIVPILGFGGKSQIGNFLFAKPNFASNMKSFLKRYIIFTLD